MIEKLNIRGITGRLNGLHIGGRGAESREKQ